MKNDNEGEGGSMALTALVVSRLRSKSALRQKVVWVGMLATGLFFGECAITPAISVLSAIEGLEAASPAFKPYVIGISLAVITGLFMMEKKGTDIVGKLFGPAMVTWFIVIALMGLPHIWANPGILDALSPLWAIKFFADRGIAGLAIIGTVTLAITGCEALYADMGHFGRKPIVLGWFGMVFPCLTINYMGQAAMVLADPKSASNPFFSMAPSWALYPLVILAAVATVIASQTVIFGVYSICKQCVGLGLLPRMGVEHTLQQADRANLHSSC